MSNPTHNDACITAAVNGSCEHEATGFNNGYRKAFAEQAAKSDPRDARIAELEAALRVFLDAETNENMGYATKADAIMRAVILARRALNPSIEGER